MPHGVGFQGAAHLALAPTFAVIWYGAVIVLQALLRAGGGGAGVRLIGFSPVALVWQPFQGLVLYVLVAAICYAVRGGREAAPVSFVEAPPPLDGGGRGRDEVWPSVDMAERIAARRRAAGLDNELLVFPDAGHNCSGSGWQPLNGSGADPVAPATARSGSHPAAPRPLPRPGDALRCGA